MRFFGNYRHLADAPAFAGYLGPLRKVEWVVYAKRPFAGPEAVLAYLSRYSASPSPTAAWRLQPLPGRTTGSRAAGAARS